MCVSDSSEPLIHMQVHTHVHAHTYENTHARTHVPVHTHIQQRREESGRAATITVMSLIIRTIQLFEHPPFSRKCD